MIVAIPAAATAAPPYEPLLYGLELFAIAAPAATAKMPTNIFAFAAEAASLAALLSVNACFCHKR